VERTGSSPRATIISSSSKSIALSMIVAVIDSVDSKINVEIGTTGEIAVTAMTATVVIAEIAEARASFVGARNNKVIKIGSRISNLVPEMAVVITATTPTR